MSETTGALVLAPRGRDGTFLANPPMQTPIDAGYVLIAIGTQQQLSALQHPRIKSVDARHHTKTLNCGGGCDALVRWRARLAAAT